MGILNWLNEHLGGMTHHSDQMLETQLENQSQLAQERTRQLTDQKLERTRDPYVNPGIDQVVDETHNGIDHGLGIANPHDFGRDLGGPGHFGSF